MFVFIELLIAGNNESISSHQNACTIYIAVVIGRRQCFRPQQHWIVKKSSLVYMVTRTVQLQKGDQQSAELRMKDGEQQQGTFRAYYRHCAYFFRWLCLMHCCWTSTKFCNLKMEISCTLLFHGSRQIRSFFLQNVKANKKFFSTKCYNLGNGNTNSGYIVQFDRTNINMDILQNQ